MDQGVRDNGADDADAGEYDEDLDERLWLAAQGQKIVIYSIMLNFVLRAVERSHLLVELLPWLFFAVTLYSLVGVVRICSGLGLGQNRKILCMVLTFIPVVNLLMLVFLSVKATRLLREAGWEVGLLGARL